jgi:hypothetical protein
MINGIPEDRHGFIDYTYVPLVWAAPALADFEQDRQAGNFCRMTAVLVLGYTLSTDAKWGVVKIIPYKTHAILDLGLGVVTIAAACIFTKSSKPARAILTLMGLTGIVVGVLSVIGARRTGPSQD